MLSLHCHSLLSRSPFTILFIYKTCFVIILHYDWPSWVTLQSKAHSSIELCRPLPKDMPAIHEGFLSAYSEVAQSCPTICDPMDCSLPSSSVHGIFQAIVLEWIAISFSSSGRLIGRFSKTSVSLTLCP